MGIIAIMSAEIDAHITKKYEIKKRLGKGVRSSFVPLQFGAIRAILLFGASSCAHQRDLIRVYFHVYRLMESSGRP